MKNFLVIGLGKFGWEVATTLTKEGAGVIAIDNNLELIEDVKDIVTQSFCLDSTDINALRSVDITNVDISIVAIGNNQEASILTTALLKELGVRNIVARSMSDLHGKILKRTGAHTVISPETQAAQQLAKTLISHDVLDRVILTEGYSMVEIKANRVFWEKTVLESGIRDQFNLLIVGIEKLEPKINDLGEVVYEKKVVHLPGPDSVIYENDILLVVGEDINIEKLANYGKD